MAMAVIAGAGTIAHARRRHTMEVHGIDQGTAAGSRIGDHSPVADLAEAHVCASEHLRTSTLGESRPIRSCTGVGAAVLEMLALLHGFRTPPVRSTLSGLRIGDPTCVVSDAHRATTIVGSSTTRRLANMGQSVSYATGGPVRIA
jgi:UDP-glucose 4-epimerase